MPLSESTNFVFKTKRKAPKKQTMATADMNEQNLSRIFKASLECLAPIPEGTGATLEPRSFLSLTRLIH